MYRIGFSSGGRRGRAGRLLAGLFMLLLPTLACVFLPQTVNREATATAEAMIVQDKLSKTLEVERQIAAQTATEQSRQVTATAAENLRQTATARAQATAAALATQQAAATATARAQATATAQAAGFSAEIDKLHAQGLLPGTTGLYHRVDDYQQNLTNASGLVVRRMGYSPSIFAVRADVSYEVAGRVANWYISGCGFAYWDNGKSDYYSVLPSLDGNIYSRAFARGRLYNLGQQFTGVPPRPAGQYHALLVVNTKGSSLFIDGKLVKKTSVIEKTAQTGAVSFVVASGSDTDFGMRCTFRNVELWIVE